LPQRELLAIRARHGTNTVYAHVCARLGRQVTDRQPGLDRFGRGGVGGGNGAERQAEMDVRRAIARVGRAAPTAVVAAAGGRGSEGGRRRDRGGSPGRAARTDGLA
jgi:hypothetical protein